MKEANINGRRYFYPLISEMPMYRNLLSAAKANLPVAHDIASRVICLPIYPDLTDVQVDAIIDFLGTAR